MNGSSSPLRTGSLLLLTFGLLTACGESGPEVRNVPDAAEAMLTPSDPAAGPREIVLAGGCFWCTEAVFEELRGVHEVVSGYAGGTAETATYSIVSSGRSDHAEAIRVSFDPELITRGQLLKVFFTVAHDPTQLNYQGPDHGRQYRSAIFYATAEEKSAAEAYIRQLTEAKVFTKPIVTTLEPLTVFYSAEDYHQDYVRLNPKQAYVTRNALPKVEKVHKYFAEWVEPK